MVNLKTIKRSKFERWLKSKGLIEVRSVGSHHAWNYPSGSDMHLSRPVIIRNVDKEIPLIHLRKNLETMNVSIDDFLKQVEKI